MVSDRDILTTRGSGQAHIISIRFGTLRGQHDVVLGHALRLAVGLGNPDEVIDILYAYDPHLGSITRRDIIAAMALIGSNSR